MKCPAGEPTRAEVCMAACAEAWRDDGAILAGPMSDVVAATGSPLVVPDDVPQTRLPTPEELTLIRAYLDRASRRERELS